MLDRFDADILNAVQKDDSQTADSLAEKVALSPSAIARRLRRLRATGWIVRTVALLAPRLTEQRLRAVVTVQLSEHADLAGNRALLQRIAASEQVQFAYELAGAFDLVLLIDSRDMAEFNQVADSVLISDSTVRRFETYFVKKQVKFAPFVRLGEAAR